MINAGPEISVLNLGRLNVANSGLLKADKNSLLLSASNIPKVVFLSKSIFSLSS